MASTSSGCCPRRGSVREERPYSLTQPFWGKLQMKSGFSSPRARCVRRGAAAILLAGVALPVSAGTSSSTTSSASSQTAQSPASGRGEEIVVIGQRLFRDVRPERDLDEAGIESYGVSTIDELLNELDGELGGEDAPLILVNGERINSIDQVGALPVETLRNVQVLPRGTAVRLGGRSGQRVVNISLRRRVRSLTATAANKWATEGDWDGKRGELILANVRGDTRMNLTFRARDESALFESERGIVQPAPRLPFALDGNIIGFPNTSGEIDPVLSTLAGRTVTIVRLPSSTPALASLAAAGNQSALTDLADYRTLRPDMRNYEVNGTFATRLAPWLTSTATVRLGRNVNHSQRGLASALFVLPAGGSYSPFSRSVGIASYRGDPLRSRSRRSNADANLTLNGTFGAWTGNFNARSTHSKDLSRSQRQSSFGNIILDSSVDPYSSDLSQLIPLRQDLARARRTNNVAQLLLTGPAAQLPAGPLQATIEGRLASNRVRSESSFALIPGERSFRRAEQWGRTAFDIPITSRANNVLPAIGDFSATAELSRVHFSDAGTLKQHGIGLTWEPVPILRLRAEVEQADAPASVEMLGNPVFLYHDVRTFDPLTGTTVDVTQISGGNAALLPEKTKIRRVSGLLRLVPKLNLQLNAEYTDTDRRNFISSLPEASAAITLAFPDRFVRDSNGVLTTVDLRPVNFASDREKRMRWGLSMNARLAGGTRAAALSPGGLRAIAPTTYLQVNANHSVVFSDEIRIRSGLDPVDLLSGGAIGIGGGRLRHQLDGNASLTSGGVGARIGANWRGNSTLQSRFGGVSDTLRFSPVFLLNLRAFADARRILPKSRWAKGLRISLDVLNLLNDRQEVRNSSGITPLQYQPGYRDALGRTIEFEVRKVF